MKSPKSMKRKVVSGLFWQISEKCGVQIVQALVQLTLARLLDPEAYGILGIITVFVTVCQCFVQSGLGKTRSFRKNRSTSSDFVLCFFCEYFSFRFGLCSPVLFGPCHRSLLSGTEFDALYQDTGNSAADCAGEQYRKYWSSCPAKCSLRKALSTTCVPFWYTGVLVSPWPIWAYGR